ncbi:MAG: Flp family type IVb pilin [Bryobacterales bacterium]|nr:Flp family type IVb pilin [Bryobacterales bacterium]
MGLKLTGSSTRLREKAMWLTVVLESKLCRDERGQDMIEYALMAAFLAVAVAAIFPQTIAPNISQIFSKVNSSLGGAAAI